MSVTRSRQDLGFAHFTRPPTNFRHHSAPQHHFLDRPVHIPSQHTASHHRSIKPLYRPPLAPITGNPLRSYQYRPVRTMADQDFGMDLMFGDYLHDVDDTLGFPKQHVQTPVFLQAMPNNFSFRPWQPGENGYAAPLPKGSPLLPAKVESNLDVPTPAVLSTSVDVSRYEPIHHRDWLEALPEYSGISPASDDIFNSSPLSEDIETFSDRAVGNGPHHWRVGQYFGSHSNQRPSIPSSFKDGRSTASPAMSSDESEQAQNVQPWSTSMFGHPDVVPPSRFHSQSDVHPPLTAAPHEIERPVSQSSGTILTFVPTMRSRRMSASDGSYVKRRDKLLIDLRRKGHSYKEIKRLGRFTEAESTLRGRLRTLTKEKSERVRKPKWNRRDVQLLHEAVDHFSSELEKSSRKRTSFRKLPWKQISQRMKDQGSSYLFAPATCAKKWDET